ncbi:MAG: SGNH/GDSL hydrolase family protein [Planctomycetota bacterium]
MSVPSRTTGATLARRVGAFLLGLLLLEGSLRIAGHVYLERGARVGAQDGAAAFRIVCVGDSNTYGLWEDAAEAYPARLGELLASRGADGPYRVLNLGVPGLSSSMVAARFGETLEQHRPDLVLALVGVNDLWTFAGEGEVAAEPWYERLRIAKLIRLALQRGESVADDGAQVHVDRSGRAVSVPAGTEALESNLLERLPRSLAALNALAAERGVPVVFLTYASDTGSYGLASDVVRSSADELGLAWIDVRARLVAGPPALDGVAAFHSDGHPTALGYELFARHVYRALTESGHVAGEPLEDPGAALATASYADAKLRFDRRKSELVLVGEEPGRDFAIALSVGPPPRPGRGAQHQNARLPLNDDWLFKQSLASPELRGRTDADGAARVSLGPLIEANRRADGEPLDLRACCLMRSAGEGRTIRRVGPAVRFHLR